MGSIHTPVAQRQFRRKRRMLRDGMKADIVVFDPKTVKSPDGCRMRRQYDDFPARQAETAIAVLDADARCVRDAGRHLLRMLDDDVETRHRRLHLCLRR